MPTSQIPICSICGSEDVCSTATVRWSKDRQDWVISYVFEDFTCDHCNTDVGVKHIPMDASDAPQLVMFKKGDLVTPRTGGPLMLVLSSNESETAVCFYDETSAAIKTFKVLTPAFELQDSDVQTSYQELIDGGLVLIAEVGCFDGSHHKQWALDQLVRHLTQTDEGYAAWVSNFRDGMDGPETYDWDEGIAP